MLYYTAYTNADVYYQSCRKLSAMNGFDKSNSFKVALDKIVKFSFWLNFIYHVIVTANLQIQKEKFKNFF